MTRLIVFSASTGVISTHTPARGVTANALYTEMHETISTHTPARGVTISQIKKDAAIANFYSHAREGRDDKMNLLTVDYEISTHTPARGVTEYSNSCSARTEFLLTRPRGA